MLPLHLKMSLQTNVLFKRTHCADETPFSEHLAKRKLSQVQCLPNTTAAHTRIISTLRQFRCLPSVTVSRRKISSLILTPIHALAVAYHMHLGPGTVVFWCLQQSYFGFTSVSPRSGSVCWSLSIHTLLPERCRHCRTCHLEELPVSFRLITLQLSSNLL